ncbi:uncharacterized protein METZ01_LOCUS106109, partial [marine metagenome]
MIISFDDIFYQPMPHYVRLIQINKTNAIDLFQNLFSLKQPRIVFIRNIHLCLVA